MSNQGHPGSLDLSGYSLGPGQSLPDPTPGQPASSGRARSLGPRHRSDHQKAGALSPGPFSITKKAVGLLVPRNELFSSRRTPRLVSTFPTRNVRGLKPKSRPGVLCTSPASALNSPGRPRRTPPTQDDRCHVPGPPRGQTQLQAPSSPVAPCGGASGGGERRLSCGTPGGTSSQRARRTPSPRLPPPPACAAWENRADSEATWQGGGESWLGLQLCPPCPPRFPHTHHTPSPSRWENLGGPPGGRGSDKSPGSGNQEKRLPRLWGGPRSQERKVG